MSATTGGTGRTDADGVPTADDGQHDGAAPGSTEELEAVLASADPGTGDRGRHAARGDRPSRAHDEGAAAGFSSRRTLTVRAEAARQVTRRRTLVTAVLLAALPLLLVGAFALGNEDDDGPPDFVALATEGGANLTLFTLFVVTSFLVPLVVALVWGDPLSSEASWSSLRYLLLSPVPRGRLLRSKLVVGVVTSFLAVLELVLVTYLVGTLAYGTAPLEAPGGELFTTGEGVWRLAVASAYVLLLTFPIGAFAFFVGTRTDAPLAAVGSAVLLLVLSTVLDQIQALGVLREGLPTHFQFSWVALLQAEPVWDDMLAGALWALLWTVVLVRLGFWCFARKDVLS